ncbi:hypothetical protein SAMN03159496_01471 [Rhizobium sp. NFR07]|nr:hypothetical protein SAMN03159496_01471 [Rhizobium sp. NFR07]
MPAIVAGADQDDDSREGETVSPSLSLSHIDLLAETQIFGDPVAASPSVPSSPRAHPSHPSPPAAPTPSPSPFVGAASAASANLYSATDVALFRALTGYHLDIRTSMPRAMDDSGNRASARDRLFTTLAEEAFKLADRQRRMRSLPDGDLTADDLVLSLDPIRRAAAAIGSRGLAAFETLEAAVARLKATMMAAPLMTDAGPVAA